MLHDRRCRWLIWAFVFVLTLAISIIKADEMLKQAKGVVYGRIEQLERIANDR